MYAKMGDIAVRIMRIYKGDKVNSTLTLS